MDPFELNRSIRSKRDGYKLCDIDNFPDKRIISVRGQNIEVSASYLSLHSSFFHKLFYVDDNVFYVYKTVELDEDPKIFGDLLDFIYPSMKSTNCCVECSDSFLTRFKLGVKLRLRFAVRRLIEGANEKYLPKILQTLARQKFLLVDIKKSIIDRFGSSDDIRKKFPKITSSVFEETEEKEPVLTTNFPDTCLINLRSSFFQVSASSLSLHSPRMRNLLFSNNGKIKHFVESIFDPTSFKLFINATKGIFPNEYSSSLLDILWELDAIGLYQYYKEPIVRDISRWTGDPNCQPIICLLNHLHNSHLLNVDNFANITRNVCPTTVYIIIRKCHFAEIYFDKLIKSGQSTQSVLRNNDNKKENIDDPSPVEDWSFGEIFIQPFVGGEYITLYVEASTFVEDLKYKIEDKLGIHPDRQRLIYLCRQLEDGRTMAYYDIRKGKTVYLREMLRGC